LALAYISRNSFWKFEGGGSAETEELEFLEIWRPQNAQFPVEWKLDPKPAEIWASRKFLLSDTPVYVEGRRL
jgi:hypothetical protein